MVKILCVWYLYRTYWFYFYKETLQKAVYDYDLNYKPKVNKENSNNDSRDNKAKKIASKQNRRTRKWNSEKYW